MDLGGFSGQSDEGIRSHFFRHFMHQLFNAERRFKDHAGTGRRGDHVQRSGTASAFYGQKSAKSELIGRERAGGDGKCQCGNAGNNDRFDPRFDGTAHQKKTGICNTGHTGIADQNDFLAVLYALNDFRCFSVFVENMISDQPFVNIKMILQDPGPARIFGKDHIRLFQRADRAESHVIQITDRGSNKK